MEPVTVEWLVQASGGRLLCGDPQAVITSVSINSKEVSPGALFVPIIGEKVDAHRFLPMALEKGAAAVFTQEHDQTEAQGAWIRVEDTLAALQAIAANYRAKFDIPVVGITGSVGKTSTKEMVAAALSGKFQVMKTAGNFNSQIGLPLTVFQLEKHHQAAVIEMGMSDFGEMARLSRIARPDRAIMTNIGISHIEQLQTQKNIRSEKLHITDCFHPNSVLFLNGDDPLLRELIDTLPVKTVSFGLEPPCDYQATEIQSDGEKTSFTLIYPGGKEHLTIPVIGNHHVSNALAAVAVSVDMGLTMQEIQQGLQGYQGAVMRQQIHRLPQISVIDDSYNASPDSAKSGLSVLTALNQTGKKVAVLADMLELGERSVQAHYELGRFAAEAGVNLLVSVGEKAEEIARGAEKCGVQVKKCHSNEEASAYLRQELRQGDVVLVKGSRSMRTDEIVKKLLEWFQE